MAIPNISKNEVTYDEAMNLEPATVFTYVTKRGIIFNLYKDNNNLRDIRTHEKFSKKEIGNDADLIITGKLNSDELTDY